MMVFEGGVIGRYFSYEGGAFMNGISVLLKEAPETSLASTYENTQREQVMHPAERFHQNTTVQEP